jgi:hypothetical protein
MAQGSVVYLGDAAADAGRWQGRLEGPLNFLTNSTDAAAATNTGRPQFVIAGAGDEFVLEPVNLMPPGKTPPLTLSGSLETTGYTFTLIGTATEAQMRSLETALPPFGEGLDTLLPDLFRDATKPAKISLVCSRKWGADSKETCAAIPAEITPAKPHHANKASSR